jgi:RNA polymerase-interacting CarD/CdnL/TRCF family regulator
VPARQLTIEPGSSATYVTIRNVTDDNDQKRIAKILAKLSEQRRLVWEFR